MVSLTLSFVFTAASLSLLCTTSAARSVHSETFNKRLAGNWYHSDDHPAYSLFRRQEQTDGVTYPAVGTDAWSAGYPPSSPDPDDLPQAWVDALNAAVSAGNIPDIPQSTMGSDGEPAYPGGLSPTSSQVCSSTYQCRTPGDIWDAPDGVFGASFDDGPLPTSPKLYTFLHDNKVHATHFMIGVNILENPDVFSQAFDTNGDDIAVHTWTHPYMTTLSNLEVVGELGWTMQLIHNSTGGRLPRYWRPPYGDSDTRVGAIAREVFGLTTIVWNQDTDDWSLTTGGTTPSKVHSAMSKWLSGPKSPGLIILEHELSDMSVQAFIDAYPLIGQHGWKFVSVAEVSGDGAYQNVDSDGSVNEVPSPVLGESASDEDASSASSSAGVAAISVSSNATDVMTATGASSTGDLTRTSNGNGGGEGASSTATGSGTPKLQDTQTGGARRLFAMPAWPTSLFSAIAVFGAAILA
ncbi:carbohydrate esterase family 4 protein [Obba rivulosa]|uniref:chitin deacetylase n=1 Tax=Obba rivulosa TaxID=1052685 RepID=A0A8E2DQU6_9APHY|nr:carbohydrate esterase family 4 protein [Obba rivulosa]